MTSSPPVILEKLGRVARVTMNRPEKRNPLTREVQEALVSALDDVLKDDAIRVVMTTGAGDISFCAGMSLAKLKERHEHPGSVKFPDITGVFRDFPKVTLAVVNGYALGAGLSLVNCHDLAIASEEKAQFGLPEIIRGFVPRVAIAPLFRMTHTKWAFEMLLSGRNWDAQRAYQAGIINRVAPHAGLHEAALKWAEEIAEWDPITLKYCKKAAYASVDVPTYGQAVDMVAYWQSEEAKANPRSSQGLRDFLDGKGIKADR
ncbi:MAG: enoyl-CoA hydratase/isomerase family protein [Chloroflexi bacterium]|nr:enoyl-CoA hydratase/isomerase family protein [Chloroflexota bacterium]